MKANQCGFGQYNFWLSSRDSTLDKQGRELYARLSVRAECAATTSTNRRQKLPLPRIVTERNFSHIPSRGKGVQLLPFLNSKENSGLKEELHGWKTKYTDHLGR
jgi:hypothetical protein